MMTEEQIKTAAIGVAMRHCFCYVIGREQEVYDVLVDSGDADIGGIYDNVQWMLDTYLPEPNEHGEYVTAWNIFEGISVEDLQWVVTCLVDDICHSMKGE